MTNATPPADRSTDADELDLRWLLAVLRRSWFVVAGCAAAAVAFQAVRQHGDLPIYRVEMEVAAVSAPEAEASCATPIPHQSSGHGLLRRPTPLAFTVYIESLRTREVADAVSRDPNLLRDLLPGKTASPSPDQAGALLQDYLRERFSVVQDESRRKFAVLRLQSTRPDAAARLLEALSQASDEQVRLAALDRAKRMIADLDAVPAANANPAIAQIRTEQQRIEVTALSTAPFAAQPLGRPTTQPKPLNRPIKALFTALVVGAALGSAVAVLLNGAAALRRRPRDRAPG